MLRGRFGLGGQDSVVGLQEPVEDLASVEELFIGHMAHEHGLDTKAEHGDLFGTAPSLILDVDHLPQEAMIRRPRFAGVLVSERGAAATWDRREGVVGWNGEDHHGETIA